jgi:uncharacterized protein YrrD
VIAFSTIRGQRVVSRSTAETLGKVDDITLDVGSRQVATFQLGKGRKAQALPWANVYGVGPDAVVAEGDASLLDAGGLQSPINHLSLSDLGNALGDITDVEFDEQTGQLASVTTPAGVIEADRLLVVGPYATIVAAREGSAVPG